MADLSREYVHERIVAAMASAARAIGIDVDMAALAPTRYRKGADLLVPTDEHLAVARAIFSDPRETLGLELAQALPLESTGLWGFLLRSSPTFGEMLRRAERYMRLANRYPEFALKGRGPNVALVCEHPNPSPYGRREQVAMAFLSHWIAWGRELSGNALVVDEARFRWRGPRDLPIRALFRWAATLRSRRRCAGA